MSKINQYSALVIFILIGAFSGFLSAFLCGANNLASSGSPAIYYLPGLFFGIAIFAGTFLFKKLPPLQGLFWVIGSTVTYYVAVYVALFLESTGASFPIAGFIGALLLGTVYSGLFSRLGTKKLAIFAVLGTFLAIPQFYQGNITALITAWQAGMGGCLGYWMAQEKK